jgi:hypothetical protein
VPDCDRCPCLHARTAEDRQANHVHSPCKTIKSKVTPRGHVTGCLRNVMSFLTRSRPHFTAHAYILHVVKTLCDNLLWCLFVGCLCGTNNTQINSSHFLKYSGTSFTGISANGRLLLVEI